MPASAAPQSRPGGRSARIRAALHEATVALIAERGADALTIPLVAERAGVHPTSVYRRYGTVGGLLAAVAVSRLTGGLVVPDRGSLREDLKAWAQDVRTDLADPDALALMRSMLGAAGDTEAPCACLDDRREQLTTILERAAERDPEAALPDLETLLERLLGPIYFRALFDAEPIDPDRLAALVEAAL